MEFYKLYFLVHHRTDWPRLYRWQRRVMMPEWYAEREERAELMLKRFFLGASILEQTLRGIRL